MRVARIYLDADYILLSLVRSRGTTKCLLNIHMFLFIFKLYQVICKEGIKHLGYDFANKTRNYYFAIYEALIHQS